MQNCATYNVMPDLALATKQCGLTLLNSPPDNEVADLEGHEQAVMQYRTLGKTGLAISVFSFGAGPISTLMVGDKGDCQRAVVEYAIQQGINWFDTAATYGNGRSEENLGRVLEELGTPRVHVATKVRLTGDDLADIGGAVRQSVEGSLRRLRRPSVTLLQLHNSITRRRGDEPTSVTVADVLGAGGVADAFDDLRAQGLVLHVGLTGIGHPVALREVIQSGRFQTMQTPYHLLNPSAGRDIPDGFSETNYGNIIADSVRAGMGVFAIRVLAGGALAGNPPSSHTVKTPFFPLALYQRDQQAAVRLQQVLGAARPLAREAIRFALAHPQIGSAIIGFAETKQIDEALEAVASSVAPIEWDELLGGRTNSIL
jgi:aryl-alcohol dehydrogenase-like predicted oxidoreductase